MEETMFKLGAIPSKKGRARLFNQSEIREINCL